MRLRALYGLGSLIFILSVVYYVVLPRSVHRFVTAATPHAFAPDFEYPISGPAETFFPIDSVVSYNYTDGSGVQELYERLARYAAFSPILSDTLRTKYVIWPGDACDPILPYERHVEEGGKAIIILRGNCTFTDKLKNVLELSLDPSAVIIANDEPKRGLITMFSRKFNEDGSLKIPIFFINNEDYVIYSEFEDRNLTLHFRTASLGGWFSLVFSLIFSPPILILSCYLVLFLTLRVQKYCASRLNTRLVKSLPVYCFNKDHLIEVHHLDHYLKVTNQSANHANNDSTRNLVSGHGHSSSSTQLILNGIDIRALAKDLHVLTAPEDFYPALKCSICLENYIPLESSVLILSCKHFYHEKCLSNWLINFRKSCPLCNRTIKISGILGPSNENDETRRLLPGSLSPDYSGVGPDLEAQVPLIARPIPIDSDQTTDGGADSGAAESEASRRSSAIVSDKPESFITASCWTSPKSINETIDVTNDETNDDTNDGTTEQMICETNDGTTEQLIYGIDATNDTTNANDAISNESADSVRLCEYLTPQLSVVATVTQVTPRARNRYFRLPSDSTIQLEENLSDHTPISSV